MTQVLTAPTYQLGVDLDPGIEEELICTDLVQVTHDVRTFELRRSEPGGFAFRAGQHLTVAVEIDGQTLERCYTLSSPPTRPERVSITVTRPAGTSSCPPAAASRR